MFPQALQSWAGSKAAAALYLTPFTQARSFLSPFPHFKPCGGACAAAPGHGAGSPSPSEVPCPCGGRFCEQCGGAVWCRLPMAQQGFVHLAHVCFLLPPGCQSIAAPILLGGDAEPWARRGGLFGELQVRACSHLVGLKEQLGRRIPAVAPGPAVELLQARKDRAAPGPCTLAAAPGGASEVPSSCCLQDKVWSRTASSLMGYVSSRHCFPWGIAVTSSTTRLRSSHPASCTSCARCCPWTRWESQPRWGAHAREYLCHSDRSSPAYGRCRVMPLGRDCRGPAPLRAGQPGQVTWGRGQQRQPCGLESWCCVQQPWHEPSPTSLR